MKRIYEFTVNKEEEVSEDTVETKKDGTEVTTSKKVKKEGPGENRTRIARFRVLSDNHYTTGPSSTLVWNYSLRASRCMSNRRSIQNRPALGFHDFE